MNNVHIFFKNILIEDGIMDIPLCKMVSMQVVTPTLQIDIANMKKEFYVGYHLGSQVLYVSLKNIHGEIENVTSEKEISWSFTWRYVNDKFEAFLDTKPAFSHLKGKFFHVWDDNN